MSRIAATFDALAARGKKALVPYVTAGDPHADTTPAILHAMVAAGADVIELGIPFSDPMADGPVVQRASERALARGVGLAKALAMVREFRAADARTPIVLMGYANPIERYGVDRFVADAKHAVDAGVLGVGLAKALAMVREFRAADARTPIVLMGYANPIERYGVDRFVADAKDAGVDGVLVVDYPPEECVEFAALLRGAAIDPIFLIAPTSSDARIAAVAEAGSGYVYHVSLKGVTGAGHFDIAAVKDMIPRIKAHVRLPVGVGFGIRDGATARAVAEVADAVVIGSALVQLLEGASRDDAPRVAGEFVAGIRGAIDAPAAR